jgi:hypothetical protein
MHQTNASLHLCGLLDAGQADMPAALFKLAEQHSYQGQIAFVLHLANLFCTYIAVQDEVFAHRLGLVPLNIDPRNFDFKAAEEAPSERNTVVFKLDVTCSRDSVTNEVVNDKGAPTRRGE